VIVPPEYRERHWQGFRSAMESGSADAEGIGISIPMVCADGTIRRCSIVFTLLRDARGRPVGAAGVFLEPQPDDPPFVEV
jgi:hypothetical protein